MRDVAARAGVSRSLVSTVFRDVPGASPTTRARVLAAAAELGYRPDDRARKLRSHDRSLIGVTLTAAHPFHVAVTEALHDNLQRHGYELSVNWTTKERTLTHAIDTLLAQRCAALILIGPTATDEEIETLSSEAPDVPAVIVDRHLELPTVDTVRVDDTAGLRLAVDHLKDLGHVDIGYVDGGDFISAEPRRRAYTAAMIEAGLADYTHVVPSSGGLRADGAAAGAQLLTSGTLPTALIAYNDLCAFGVLDVFSRAGVRVPEDVSVIGFDNVAEAALDHLALTTVEQRPEELASAVAEVVRARIQGAAPGGLRLMPPGPLVVRRSSGAPRQASVPAADRARKARRSPA
jgi:DNA-binding LacI/PurR family transcriptional regulator